MSPKAEQGSFMLKHLIIISLIFALTGCAQFEMGRSYLSEMEHDDSSFYTPEDDFPVMAGDTGKRGRALEDYAPATPESEEDRYQRQSQDSLKGELNSLENKLSDNKSELYQKHKNKLATTSERIYFLKLPSSEQTDYLASRGFLENRQPASLFGTRNSDLNLGMSKGDVVQSWGKPARVEVAGNPNFENERWAYQLQGATKFIYFESGTVQGWE